MSGIKYRNYAFASHLMHNHGAGQHESDFKHRKTAHIEDLCPQLSDSEMCEAIIRVAHLRAKAGLEKHFLSNFLNIGRRSDLLVCIDALAEQGIMKVFDVQECTSCGLRTKSNRYLSVEGVSGCCNNIKMRSVFEFYTL